MTRPGVSSPDSQVFQIARILAASGAGGSKDMLPGYRCLDRFDAAHVVIVSAMIRP
jgi:hypothetical protein